jgi:TolB-like protein/class 3 adenylate cyclase
MSPASLSGLKVLLMTDLVGSVSRQQRLGNEAYAGLKAQHDALVMGVVEESPSGEILEQTGDGYFIVFANVKDALRAALMIQSRIARGDWASERPQVRIGVHLGEVTPTVDEATGQARYAGITVSLTARIMDLAAGDQILLSGPVYENGESAVRAHPAEEGLPSPALRWQEHGRYEFNGIRERVRIYEVGGEGIAPFTTPPGGGKARRVKKSSPLPFWIGGATLVALLVVAAFFLFPRSDTVETRSPEPVAAPAADTPTIAVLPFVNFDGEENASFAAGVHDDILTSLAKLSQLRVISRTSVLGYANTAKNIREIGQELGVTHLVEGSIRRAGNRVRVTVQLIEAATDRHLWADNYDRELKDVFAIQSEIATQIATQLLERLSPEEAAELDRALTDSVEAYDAYNRAREQWRDSRGASPAAMEIIVEELETATAIDPAFAEAWSFLSQIRSNLVFNNFEPVEPHREAARFALRRVQRIAPESTAAYLAEAYFHYWGHRDFDAALVPLMKARLSSPNNVEILKAEAYILRRQGRFANALQLLEAAARLDPRDRNLLVNLYFFLNILGHYERAYDLRERFAEDFAHPYNGFYQAELAFLTDPSLAHQVALREALEAFPVVDDAVYFEYFVDALWAAIHLGELEFCDALVQRHWEVYGDSAELPMDLTSPRMYFAMVTGDAATARAMAVHNLEQYARVPQNTRDVDTMLIWLESIAREILGQSVDWRERARSAEASLEAANDALESLDRLPGLLILWSQADPDRAVELYRKAVEDPEIGDLLPTLTNFAGIMPQFFDHPTMQAELDARPEWKAVVDTLRAAYARF